MTKNDINLISQGISGVKTSVIQIWTYYIESSALQHVQYMCICNAYAHTTPSIGKELHFFNSLTSKACTCACMQDSICCIHSIHSVIFCRLTNDRKVLRNIYIIVSSQITLCSTPVCKIS